MVAICHQVKKKITFKITSKIANEEGDRQVDMQRNSTVKRSEYLLAPAGRETEDSQGKWVEQETITFKTSQTHVRRQTSIACFLSEFNTCAGQSGRGPYRGVKQERGSGDNREGYSRKETVAHFSLLCRPQTQMHKYKWKTKAGGTIGDKEETEGRDREPHEGGYEQNTMGVHVHLHIYMCVIENTMVNLLFDSITKKKQLREKEPSSRSERADIYEKAMEEI